jgi:hypothetical protein
LEEINLNKDRKMILLSTLLIFMISSGPLLAFAAPAEPAALAYSAEMKIAVLEDEAVQRENPNDNYFTNDHRGGLWVGSDGGGMTRSWLKFNISHVPKELGFTSAYLNVYLIDEFSTNDKAIGACYSSNDTWDETTITWNLQPTFDDTPLDVIDSPASPDMFVLGNWYSWDITAAFEDALNDDKMISLILKQIDEADMASTWKYFLDEDFDPAMAFNASYISVEYTTPDVIDMTVDGFSSTPLINYVQDSTPTLSWEMSDSGTGEYQRDYNLEVWNNADYNDTLLWSEGNSTDFIQIYDSSGGGNSRPFGTADEFRYQMKFPATLMTRSGVVDKLVFETITQTGEIVFENLQVYMLGVQNALDLTADFEANYDGVQPILVLNHPSYGATIVNGRFTLDIENTFFLNKVFNLIVELRFTNNTGTLSTTPITTGVGGSVAYTWGTDAYLSTTAANLYDRLHTLEVRFESDLIWDPASGAGNVYPFGSTVGHSGRFQIKYNKSMIAETGVIDKIWFPVNQFASEVIYENFVVRMAESPRLGELSHTDFTSNLAGATPVTVLNKATYTIRNVGFAIVIDLDNTFRYTGEHDLLIDMQWGNKLGDSVSVIRDIGTGAYRAWDLYDGGHVIGNDTRTYHMYLDFVHPDSSVEFGGTALTNGTTYYWRVRACDSTGIWSDWTNQQFKYEELSSAPEFSTPIANPSPVVVDNPVTVSINVTYFLGVHEVLMEFDGSNHSMTADGDMFSFSFTPTTAGNINYTIFMESNIRTWSSTEGLIVVNEVALIGDPTLIIIIAAAAGVVIIIVIIIFMKKGKK